MNADELIAVVIRWIVVPICAAAILAVLLTGVMVGWALADPAVDAVMVPPTEQERRDIATWIPQQCCWTNNCCRKVRPTALHPLDRDHYRVVASGQVVTRTGWSRDGQTWRCACDQDEAGRWVVHLRANTRCIFPAPTGY